MNFWKNFWTNAWLRYHGYCTRHLEQKEIFCEHEYCRKCLNEKTEKLRIKDREMLNKVDDIRKQRCVKALDKAG